MPIYGHTFFPYLNHLLPIGFTFFMGAQKRIIYRLIMRNIKNDVYFPILILIPFWRENGRGRHAGTKGLEPLVRTSFMDSPLPEFDRIELNFR